MVTHDRFMLERVSTVLLALDGEGARRRSPTMRSGKRPAPHAAPRRRTPRRPARREPRIKRLGYLEQREWDGMEDAILKAEADVDACRRAAEDPAIASDPTALQTRYAAPRDGARQVDRLYARWAELDSRAARHLASARYVGGGAASQRRRPSTTGASISMPFGPGG